MVFHVCVVGASVFKCNKSLRLFFLHVYSAALKSELLFFSPPCVLMRGCVCLRPTPTPPSPCFSLICTRGKKFEGTNPQRARPLILGKHNNWYFPLFKRKPHNTRFCRLLNAL